MAELKIRKIGNALGVILPKELLDHNQMREGDRYQVKVDGDGVHLSPFDPDFDDALKAMDECDRRYRNTLKALAK